MVEVFPSVLALVDKRSGLVLLVRVEVLLNAATSIRIFTQIEILRLLQISLCRALLLEDICCVLHRIDRCDVFCDRPQVRQPVVVCVLASQDLFHFLAVFGRLYLCGVCDVDVKENDCSRDFCLVPFLVEFFLRGKDEPSGL